jgi:hypothetical protein
VGDQHGGPAAQRPGTSVLTSAFAPLPTHSLLTFLQHYNDGLIEDLGLKPRGAARGLRYYTGLVESRNLQTLGDERRALRAGSAPNMLGRLASSVVQYLGRPRSYREIGRSKVA